MQVTLWNGGPSQKAPPLSGAGLVQLRVRRCQPRPHWALHSDHSVQDDQPPLTKDSQIHIYTRHLYTDMQFALRRMEPVRYTHWTTKRKNKQQCKINYFELYNRTQCTKELHVISYKRDNVQSACHIPTGQPGPWLKSESALKHPEDVFFFITRWMYFSYLLHSCLPN